VVLSPAAAEEWAGPRVGGGRPELGRGGGRGMGGIARTEGARLAGDLQLVGRVEPPLPALDRFVQLHQVDVVGLQAAQRGFERGTSVVARSDLGGDGDAVAVRAERPPEQDLRGAVAVCRGGIEKRDAALDGPRHSGEPVALVGGGAPGRPPYRPGPEPEPRLGGPQTRRGPDVKPGPRAHQSRSLRSGRWVPAPPSRRSRDDDSWARVPAFRRSASLPPD